MGNQLNADIARVTNNVRNTLNQAQNVNFSPNDAAWAQFTTALNTAKNGATHNSVTYNVPELMENNNQGIIRSQFDGLNTAHATCVSTYNRINTDLQTSIIPSLLNSQSVIESATRGAVKMISDVQTSIDDSMKKVSERGLQLTKEIKQYQEAAAAVPYLYVIAPTLKEERKNSSWAAEPALAALPAVGAA